MWILKNFWGWKVLTEFLLWAEGRSCGSPQIKPWEFFLRASSQGAPSQGWLLDFVSKILMGVCPVLRDGFLGFGIQSMHGMFFLPDVGVKRKTHPNSALEKRLHLGNQGTFSCCWGTVLLEAKAAWERFFQHAFHAAYCSYVFFGLYCMEERAYKVDGYSSPAAWGGCLCEPSQDPKTRRKFTGLGNWNCTSRNFPSLCKELTLQPGVPVFSCLSDHKSLVFPTDFPLYYSSHLLNSPPHFFSLHHVLISTMQHLVCYLL